MNKPTFSYKNCTDECAYDCRTHYKAQHSWDNLSYNYPNKGHMPATWKMQTYLTFTVVRPVVNNYAVCQVKRRLALKIYYRDVMQNVIRVL